MLSIFLAHSFFSFLHTLRSCSFITLKDPKSKSLQIQSGWSKGLRKYQSKNKTFILVDVSITWKKRQRYCWIQISIFLQIYRIQKNYLLKAKNEPITSTDFTLVFSHIITLKILFCSFGGDILIRTWNTYWRCQYVCEINWSSLWLDGIPFLEQCFVYNDTSTFET